VDIPVFDSRYDITSLLSDNPLSAYNTNVLTKAPIVDSWGVVLTSRPTENVIINVSPAATRTLGFEVLVQLVMAAITTSPWPIS
jgi:hypothetical protein